MGIDKRPAPMRSAAGCGSNSSAAGPGHKAPGTLPLHSILGKAAAPTLCARPRSAKNAKSANFRQAGRMRLIGLAGNPWEAGAFAGPPGPKRKRCFQALTRLAAEP